MRRLLTIALVATLPLAPMKAFAFMNVGDYVGEKDADARALNKIYLSGIMQGLQTYNSIQVVDKERVIFCIPANSAITEDQADHILITWQQLQHGQATEKLPIGLGMLYALAQAFPCRKSD